MQKIVYLITKTVLKREPSPRVVNKEQLSKALFAAGILMIFIGVFVLLNKTTSAAQTRATTSSTTTNYTETYTVTGWRQMQLYHAFKHGSHDSWSPRTYWTSWLTLGPAEWTIGGTINGVGQIHEIWSVPTSGCQADSLDNAYGSREVYWMSLPLAQDQKKVEPPEYKQNDCWDDGVAPFKVDFTDANENLWPRYTTTSVIPVGNPPMDPQINLAQCMASITTWDFSKNDPDHSLFTLSLPTTKCFTDTGGAYGGTNPSWGSGGFYVEDGSRGSVWFYPTGLYGVWTIIGSNNVPGIKNPTFHSWPEKWVINGCVTDDPNISCTPTQ